MALDNIEQQNSQEIISSQETQSLITKMETEKPDVADFAKKFQKSDKIKNKPDWNSELVASISVLSEIKNKSQFKLATQILEKQI